MKQTCATRRSPPYSLLLVLFLPCSYAFVIRGSQVPRRDSWKKVLQSQNNDDDLANDEGIFFDDFDFTVGSGGSDQSSSSTSSSSAGANVLQQRLSQLVATQEESSQQVLENWKQGHWSVRGCSLDPGDAGFGESRVQVSSLLSFMEDEGDETILVGRTDGSLCWLALGSEYLATFTNQYVAREASNDTIAVTEELKRDSAHSIPMPLEGVSNVDEASAALSDRATSNFEILAQVQASDAAILDMAVVRDGTSDHQVLYALSQSLTDPVQQFQIQEDGPVGREGASLPVSDVDSSSSVVPVVAIRALRDRFLLSISQSGLASVWRPEKMASSMVTSFTVPLEDDDTILSCDADDDFVYVGTSLGFVFVYAVDKILDNKNKIPPIKTFSAFTNAGVSSICAAGEGVMGKGRPTPTLALVTGSTLGEIKQWELLPRGVNSLEYWPKMSSQKLPGKAHVLMKGPVQSLAESTAGSAILNLRPVQEGVILSATKHQLTIWNTATGDTFCDMHGLDFEQGACCLVLSEHLLVTNGLKQYVCVHDFSIDPNLTVKDMIVPMDDEDE